ncbi:hypothetical protein SBOR_2166 [Sclerotinia borealis F-4128]|uniref:Uncharacterized protein n=1 Tax=Sclerotinia borealis (strain F-4128) TaxID=1432307 RepID=W9CKZ9_SCLBF|nr:hypothetical protein SBOR_2166 [Sclerotinia borealis F-4128]
MVAMDLMEPSRRENKVDEGDGGGGKGKDSYVQSPSDGQRGTFSHSSGMGSSSGMGREVMGMVQVAISFFPSVRVRQGKEEERNRRCEKSNIRYTKRTTGTTSSEIFPGRGINSK